MTRQPAPQPAAHQSKPHDRRPYRPLQAAGPHRPVLHFLIFLWFLSAAIAPDIEIPTFGRARPEDAIAVLLALMALPRTLRARGWNPILYSLIALTAAFAVLGFLGLTLAPKGALTGSGTFGTNVQGEILKEAVRFAKYIVIAFAFGYAGMRASALALRALGIGCVILVAVQVAQFLRVPGMTTTLMRFYTPSPEWYDYTWGIDMGQWRSGSLMLNPNVLGGFLVLPLMISLVAVLSRIAQGRKWVKSWMLLLLLCVIAGIFMTQGRTILLGGMMGATAATAYLTWKGRILVRHVTAAMIILGIAAIGLALAFGETVYRFTPKGIAHGFGDASMSVKRDLTLQAIGSLRGPHILFGLGPANSIMVDNELGYVICWYGYLGLLTWLAFYAALILVVLQKVGNVYMRAALLGTLAVYMVGALASSFLINNRVFPVFLAFSVLVTTAAVRVPRRMRVRSVSPSWNPTTSTDTATSVG